MHSYISIYTHIHIAMNIHIYIYICTHIHCSKSVSNRNVSNALFLTSRCQHLFRTPCSQHVIPANMFRPTLSKRFEEVHMLRTARSKRCVAT